MSNNGKEIENLNLDNLDVKEREGRRELAIFGVDVHRFRRSTPIRRLKQGLKVSIAGLFAIGFAGCTQASTPPESVHSDTFEISEADNSTFQGVGNVENLTSEERTNYASDQRHMQRLAPNGETIVINHADERQHRFVMARLRMAGKTPENSPQLYNRISERRRIQLAQQIDVGPKSKTFALSAEPENMHYLGSLNINSSTNMEVIASGTVKDTIYYGYLDALAADANGNMLGSMPYIETYSNMPYASVKATGDLTLTGLSTFVGDSLMIEDNEVYGYRETYTARTTERPAAFALGAITVTAPKDKVPAPLDGTILVCLSRGGTNCDYNLLGTLEVKLPLVGNVSIAATAAGFTFDQAKIDQFKAGTATDQNGANVSGANIRIALKNTGGACAQRTTKNLTTSAREFWNTVKLSLDKRTLSWNMPDIAPASFGTGCQLVQDNVELSMMVQLPFRDSFNNPGQQLITITNNPLATRTDVRIPNIRMTNSCLAAGTMIEMGSGWMLPIDEVQTGDMVSNPFDRSDFSLQVTDTVLGTESTPMVRIEDEHGKSLLMTEMHPIDVVGRGMVLAKYLKAGDVVSTKDGPSQLVTVGREQYNGYVYNLKLGTGAEMKGLAKDQTTVYANGFLVGDVQVQGNYESAELVSSGKPVRLSTQWRNDYLNSAKH